MAKKIWFTGTRNFHFLDDLIDCFGRDGLVAESEESADIIWSEWAAGPSREAVKRNKGKPIIVRCHAYELEKPKILTSIDFENVNCLLFVSEAKRELFRNRYPSIRVRTECIPNALNTNRFIPQRSWDCGYRIGMLGRIMGALLLLRKLDPRWQLHIKGEVGRKSHRHFLYLRIFKALLGLGKRVHFFPFDKEPQAFLNSIDIILSNSKRESFHAVVAEGMCCGCYPVVRDWSGARQIYPVASIFSSTHEFAHRVRIYEAMNERQREASGEESRTYVESRFGLEKVYRQCKELVSSL